MIYSDKRCPICGQDLLCSTVGKDPNFLHTYVCPETVPARNDFNSNSFRSHYILRVTTGPEPTSRGSKYATIVIPPFLLEFLDFERSTTVSTCSPWESKKFAFRCPELDMDWARTHDVIRRLKVLVTLS